MSVQAWTIVGVAVGAILSFLAQWHLARLKRSDDRAHELRIARREAYSRFLGARYRTMQAVTRFVNNQPDENTAFEGLRQANVELQDAIGAIGIVSPRDTFSAAKNLGDATLKSQSPGGAALDDQASVVFMTLARRDAGSDPVTIGAFKSRLARLLRLQAH